jgi:hypothetical protein
VPVVSLFGKESCGRRMARRLAVQFARVGSGRTRLIQIGFPDGTQNLATAGADADIRLSPMAGTWRRPIPGIRVKDRVFETARFNHSRTSPHLNYPSSLDLRPLSLPKFYHFPARRRSVTTLSLCAAASDRTARAFAARFVCA